MIPANGGHRPDRHHITQLPSFLFCLRSIRRFCRNQKKEIFFPPKTKNPVDARREVVICEPANSSKRIFGTHNPPFQNQPFPLSPSQREGGGGRRRGGSGHVGQKIAREKGLGKPPDFQGLQQLRGARMPKPPTSSQARRRGDQARDAKKEACGRDSPKDGAGWRGEIPLLP
jgi:hypothetical protein